MPARDNSLQLISTSSMVLRLSGRRLGRYCGSSPVVLDFARQVPHANPGFIPPRTLRRIRGGLALTRAAQAWYQAEDPGKALRRPRLPYRAAGRVGDPRG